MSDQTSLLDAFRKNNFEEAKNLLDNKENIPSDLKEFERIQLFDTLIRGKAYDIILIFLDNGLIEKDVYEYDSFKGSLFESIFKWMAVDEESINFLDTLLPQLENIDDEIQDQTLLGLAIEEGAAAEVITSLINAGCSANYVNNAEQNYLHQLVRNNRINPEKAAAMLQLLIDEGVDVNAADIERKSPLLLAISNNKKQLIPILLENNASCNQQDKSGESPYYFVVVHLQDFALYKQMKEYEMPDFTLQTKNGETILYEYIRRLNRPTETALQFLAQLISDGADVLQPSMWYSKEATPLARATEQPIDVFKTVIDLTDIDINTAVDAQGNTLLHLVCAYNINFDKDQARDTYRKVKLLLEKGADPSLVNSQDQTALTLASGDNLKIKTVELLMSSSAS